MKASNDNKTEKDGWNSMYPRKNKSHANPFLSPNVLKRSLSAKASVRPSCRAKEGR